MKAIVTHMIIPVVPDNATDVMHVYRVDYVDYHIVGYHESETIRGTFGVYENESVAHFVADGIESGDIRTLPIQEFHKDED